MNYFGDSDIPTLFRDFGRPVTIGGVAGVGIPDFNDELIETSDGPDRGKVVIKISAITIQTNQFPGCHIGDAVLFDAIAYTVRERLREGDGALTKILLGV